jgi:hypothetical protein
MGSLRVIWERALEQHDGMDHAPPDAPGRHDPDGLPALAPQLVEALDLAPTFHKIECRVLPALHTSSVADPRFVVYRPAAPKRRTERPLDPSARVHGLHSSPAECVRLQGSARDADPVGMTV